MKDVVRIAPAQGDPGLDRMNALPTATSPVSWSSIGSTTS